jgi:hypothetical protein
MAGVHSDRISVGLKLKPSAATMSDSIHVSINSLVKPKHPTGSVQARRPLGEFSSKLTQRESAVH